VGLKIIIMSTAIRAKETVLESVKTRIRTVYMENPREAVEVFVDEEGESEKRVWEERWKL
jgi:hypothetical protein